MERRGRSCLSFSSVRASVCARFSRLPPSSDPGRGAGGQTAPRRAAGRYRSVLQVGGQGSRISANHRGTAPLPLCLVCMVITYSRSMDQPGKVANLARGQPKRENEHFPVPVRA